MGWELRDGNYYYYRKRRQGDSVVSEYVGPGFMGTLAEELDQDERAESEQARVAIRKHRKKAREIEQVVGKFESNVNTLIRALLLVSGYHPHKHQWRKRRNARS